MDAGGDEHPALAAEDEGPVIVADVEGLEEGGGDRRRHCQQQRH